MDFSAHNPKSSNALNLAARENDLKSVRRLLGKINPNCIDNRGWTCMHEAAHEDNFECLELILNDKRCRTTCETYEGHTALYLACRNKASIETIKLLLDKTPDIVNIGSNEYVTPLHVACAQGRVELIQLLIDYGALINVIDADGDTPLHDAITNTQYEAVTILLHAGADVAIPNDRGCRPIHIAATKGSLPIVKEILKFEIEINAKTNHGHTPLMLSVISENIEVLNFLIESGAIIWLVDSKGTLALDIALIRGCADIFIKLLSVTPIRKMNRRLIYNACKPHYVNIKMLEALLNSNLDAEFFNFPTTKYKIEVGPYCFSRNSPLNVYLSICDYIYESSPELFEKFLYIFLMRGANVNTYDYLECPPLLYLLQWTNDKCFTATFNILINFGCNVDLSLDKCSKRAPKNLVPPAFRVALSVQPSAVISMLPYSLYCDPSELLLYYLNMQKSGIDSKEIYNYLLERTDNVTTISKKGWKSIPFFIPSLRQICRHKIRKTIRKSKWSKTKYSMQFVNIINSLPLPRPVCNYLRYM